jgi:hypothetical protein
MVVSMPEATTAEFVELARALSAASRSLRLRAPGFRSPPRLGGTARSLRRWPDGTTQVAVQVRGRPLTAVAADMVDGIVAANRLVGGDAHTARTSLWAAIGHTVSRQVERPRVA